MRGRKGAREGVMNGGRDRWREGGRDAGREGGSRRDGICPSLAGWFGFIEVTPVHSHGVAIRSYPESMLSYLRRNSSRK